MHIEQAFREYCPSLQYIIIDETGFNGYKQEGQVTAMRRHHYRVVNPVRFFIFILISVMIMVFAAYGIFRIGSAEATGTDSYAEVVIDENDTLWDLASHYNPDGNIRDIVHEIYDVNGISADDIQPGMKILVPIH